MSTHSVPRLGGDGIRHPLWWMGWRPRPTVAGANLGGFALGNALMIPGSFVTGGVGFTTLVTFTVAGFVAGVGLWRFGVREVNRRAEHVLAAFREVPDAAGERTYELLSSEGVKPFVEPNAEYTASRIALGDAAVSVERTTLDTVTRRVSSDDSFDVPYADVDGVRVDDDALLVETAAETFHFDAGDEASDDPTAVRDALRDALDDR